MSKCISMHGEYSEHDLPGTTFGEFDCNLCYAFDEDAAMAEITRLRAKVARAEALPADWMDEVDWSDGRNNYGDNEAYEKCARQLTAALADPDPP